MLKGMIFCHYCGGSIDITLDEDIGTGDFNMMTCPHCGRRFLYKVDIEWFLRERDRHSHDEDGDDVANDNDGHPKKED